MLILIPILLIILTLYIIDVVYFEDVKPKNLEENKVITKDANMSTQKYLDKYLKK
jgi:uncharacterized membrane protein